MPSPRAPGVLGDALYGLATVIVRATPRELSLTAASVLSALERGGAQRITDLAGSQGVAQPSMTSLVTRLERFGLVRRQTDPSDGRVVLAALAEGGAEHLARRRRQGRQAVEGLLDRLPADDLDVLEAALPAIRRILDLERVELPAITTTEVPA
ncbi:MAG: MarR family winged helix-turn-helix transcriptional regulator [Acidimicrobiales bacterium]